MVLLWVDKSANILFQSSYVSLANDPDLFQGRGISKRPPFGQDVCQQRFDL